jgi:ATP-binding cassette subfamily C protein
VILAALALATEIVTRQPTKSATGCAMARNGLAETTQRNAEVLVAMGMVGRIQDRWSEINASCVASHKLMSDVADSLGAISRTLRMMLQSGLLAVGAYLVVHQEATGGVIIAGSILGGRALGPVDLAIANWRSFVAARQSWGRLGKLLALCPVEALPLPLHKPEKAVTMESVSVAPPGEPRLVVQDASFTLNAGQALGVIGPSASGKSSLVRLLVGVWAPLRGKVCLDGASLNQWAPDTRGRHIGYLPQDVELLAGSVAENIARFEPHADPNAVVAAAHAAGVHDVIIKLPDGYDTEVGEQGSALSAGQRQWIALARAFYGDPFLVVLDEPNSNLDAVGEEALARAIARARSRRAIVVVVARRPSMIAAVDLVLVMANGRVQAFGPKDEVLGAVLRRDVPAVRPPNVISLAGAASS